MEKTREKKEILFFLFISSSTKENRSGIEGLARVEGERTNMEEKALVSSSTTAGQYKSKSLLIYPR